MKVMDGIDGALNLSVMRWEVRTIMFICLLCQESKVLG